jgi:hypothetical protein
MNWRDLSSKVKWALIMMLVAILPGLAGITINTVVFGETVPPFVYVLPAIWLILFFISLTKLRTGLITGIIWASINVLIPVIVVLKGIKSPIAKTLGIPVCPFSIVGMIISIAVIYLCFRAYREVTATGV